LIKKVLWHRIGNGESNIKRMIVLLMIIYTRMNRFGRQGAAPIQRFRLTGHANGTDF